METVFIGVYDSDPSLTRGCTDETTCTISFPIQKLAPPDSIGVAQVTNETLESKDLSTGGGSGSRSLDLANLSNFTDAIWSGPIAEPEGVPIPLAATGVLGAVLLGLGVWSGVPRGR